MAILADGIGSTHGVTRTIEEIRQRGVPASRSRSSAPTPRSTGACPAVAEIEVPFYPGLRIGVPSLPAAVQTLADGGFDAIHVCSPGPGRDRGRARRPRARAAADRQLPHRADRLRAACAPAQRRLAEAMALAVGAFYSACDVVLSPSPASDEALAAIGMPAASR